MNQLPQQSDTGHANTEFARAFDPQWLKENLPRRLWRENEAMGAIVQLEIINAWESAKQTTVHYELGFHDPAGQWRRQMYTGFLFPEDQLDEEYKSARKKARMQPAWGRAVALVPEANLILLAFPNDRKIKLLSETQLQPWLQQNLHAVANGGLDGRRWQVQTAKVEMLRYVPEKRFTARCTARLVAPDGGAHELAFIVKQLKDEKKARKLYRDLRSLRRAWPADRVMPIRFPHALALDENSGAVFIEELSGCNLKHLLFEVELAQVLPAVGRLLADFHRAQKRVRKTITIKNELAEVREAIRIIVKTLPDFKSPFKNFYAAFKALSPVGDGIAPVLLHGTYRLNHIFFNAGELALLDLDSLRMGHPAYDVANFLSSLYYLEEAHGRITAEMRRKMAQHFLTGYAEKMANAISPAAVLWFLASLLINKQAKKYVTHSHENYSRKVERMLTLAETVMALCRQRSPGLTLAGLAAVLP
ncbi:MAG: hypothetical protein ALAOOOJD_01946 [bacterium]|nr:hypothetical protein [bacterium]